MQAPASFSLVAGILIIAGLAIGLGVAVSVPLLAAPFFLMGFIGFLLWRAKRRMETRLPERQGARVPTTAEAAADPVEDSSVGDAAASRTSARTNAP
jgi:hypothetical protein